MRLTEAGTGLWPPDSPFYEGEIGNWELAFIEASVGKHALVVRLGGFGEPQGLEGDPVLTTTWMEWDAVVLGGFSYRRYAGRGERLGWFWQVGGDVLEFEITSSYYGSDSTGQLTYFAAGGGGRLMLRKRKGVVKAFLNFSLNILVGRGTSVTVERGFGWEYFEFKPAYAGLELTLGLFL